MNSKEVSMKLIPKVIIPKLRRALMAMRYKTKQNGGVEEEVKE